MKEIENRLWKRKRWIVRQRDYFEQFRPRTPPRRYLSGETHLYLGKQYLLKRVEAEQEGVKLRSGQLWVLSPKGTPLPRVRELVDAWYRARAQIKLRERFEAMLPKFERVVDGRPELIFRHMKQRWGSHTSTGRIVLNFDLIRAPTTCIDYVIAHELAHVVHFNHSTAFVNLLQRIVPDWRSRKARLEQLLA
jgi:predicted metal-dependent hydrolase